MESARVTSTRLQLLLQIYYAHLQKGFCFRSHCFSSRPEREGGFFVDGDVFLLDPGSLSKKFMKGWGTSAWKVC